MKVVNTKQVSTDQRGGRWCNRAAPLVALRTNKHITRLTVKSRVATGCVLVANEGGRPPTGSGSGGRRSLRLRQVQAGCLSAWARATDIWSPAALFAHSITLP